MPQTDKHKLKSMIPRMGNNIHVRVGDPLYFDDLFKEYEKVRVQGTEVIL